MWKLSGSTDISTLTTDRRDASGAGYWSARDNAYQTDLLKMALGVGASAGDVIVSIGTSGTVFAVSEVPTSTHSHGASRVINTPEYLNSRER